MAKKMSAWYEIDGLEFEIDYTTGTVTIAEILFPEREGTRITGKEHDPKWLYSLSKTLEDIARFVERELAENG